MRLNLAGQPPWVVQLLNGGYRLWASHPVWANASAGARQVALGIVLWRQYQTRWGRGALWVALVWALVVWVFGEGLGGLFTPGPTYWGGAPGAGILYAAAAALVVPWRLWSSGRLMLVWGRGLGVVWWAGAALQTAAWDWTRRGNYAMLQGALRTHQPHWVTASLRQLGGVLATQPLAANAVMVGVMSLLGWMAWRDWDGLGTWTLGFLWIVTLWLGQDLGGLFTGTGTDPGVPAILGLAWAVAWVSRAPSSIRVVTPEGVKVRNYRPGRPRSGNSA